MDWQTLAKCPACEPKEECCSAIDEYQDGNEGLLVPDHVSDSVYADRLSRSSSISGRETDIPVMTPEGPSRTTSRSSSRATSPHARRFALKFSVTKIQTDSTAQSDNKAQSNAQIGKKIDFALQNLKLGQQDEDNDHSDLHKRQVSTSHVAGES